MKSTFTAFGPDGLIEDAETLAAMLRGQGLGVQVVRPTDGTDPAVTSVRVCGPDGKPFLHLEVERTATYRI